MNRVEVMALGVLVVVALAVAAWITTMAGFWVSVALTAII